MAADADLRNEYDRNYRNHIVAYHYDSVPTSECEENLESSTDRSTTDGVPGTAGIPQQGSLYEEISPAEPQRDEGGVKSTCAQRCLCIILAIFVILMICVTSVSLFYLFTTCTQPLKPVPIKSCPRSISVDAPEKSNTTTIFWNEPTVEYPVNASSIHEEQSHKSGDEFPIGSTEVLYTFSDQEGRTGTCSFLVTVIDITSPVVSKCPMDQEYVVTYVAEENVSWTEPTVYDNSGAIIHVTKSHQQGVIFPVGYTDVTYHFTDPSGNQALCVFTITIRLKPLPIKSCPRTISVDASQESNVTKIFWNEPTVEHPVTASSIHKEQSHKSGDEFPIGSTEVLYTFSDQEGRTGTCSFLVTVTDVTPPVVSNCPMDKEYIITDVAEEYVSWTEPTAYDNSGAMVNVTQSHHQGDVFPAGDTNVIYHFTDPAGNQASCVFTISIIGLNPPNITNCPLDITRNSAPVGGSTSVPVWWIEPSATDPSGGSLSFARNYQPGDSFGVGETKVKYTFTGDRGLESVCEFKVVVIDVTPPVVSDCPMDKEYRVTDAGEEYVSWPEPTVNDNSGAMINVAQSHQQGDIFPAGDTNVTYHFTDPSGNQASCVFTISIIGLNPPNITTCPLDITRKTAPVGGSTSVPVWWIEPSATDPSGGNLSIERNHQPGDYFAIGETTVKYTYTGERGLQSVCEFTVFVIDVTPPVVSNCPMDKEYIITDAVEEYVSWTEPTAYDNSGAMIHVTQSHHQGDVFPAGDTNVTYHFTDPSGNRASCVFTITMTGLNPPNITTCPFDITRSVPLGGPTSVHVWWIEPYATDPYGSTLSIERNHQPGDSFGIGETVVTYTFTGDRRLQSVCEFKVIVIVIDGSAPTIRNCPEDMVLEVPANRNSVEVWWTEPNASSASGRTVTMIELDPKYPPGSKFTIGTTTINYIFVDNIGLRNVCSFNVAVFDLIPPTIYQCPKEVVFYTNSKHDSVPVKWSKPNAEDNCGSATLISQSHSSGTLFQMGSTPIMYVFADTTGNLASCTFNVTGVLKSSASIVRSSITTLSVTAFIANIIILYYKY